MALYSNLVAFITFINSLRDQKRPRSSQSELLVVRQLSVRVLYRAFLILVLKLFHATARFEKSNSPPHSRSRRTHELPPIKSAPPFCQAA